MAHNPTVLGSKRGSKRSEAGRKKHVDGCHSQLDLACICRRCLEVANLYTAPQYSCVPFEHLYYIRSNLKRTRQKLINTKTVSLIYLLYRGYFSWGLIFAVYVVDLASTKINPRINVIVRDQIIISIDYWTCWSCVKIQPRNNFCNCTTVYIAAYVKI